MDEDKRKGPLTPAKDKRSAFKRMSGRFLRSFGNFNDSPKEETERKRSSLHASRSDPHVAALSTSEPRAGDLRNLSVEDAGGEEKASAVNFPAPASSAAPPSAQAKPQASTPNRSFSMNRKRSVSMSGNAMAPLLRARSPLNCTVPMARVKPQFGVIPSELLANYPDEPVPAILVKCTSILRNSLREQGLFRIPGKMTSILEMKISFEQGKQELLEQETNMHNITGLISQFFRELPEPLLTFRLYKAWVNAAGASEKKRLGKLKKLTKKLPQANYNILRFFIRFLVDVSKNSGANRMSAQNLALVFGASLLNPQEMDMADLAKIKLQCTIIELLITNYSMIFDDSEVTDVTPARQQQRSNVATIPAGRPGTLSPPPPPSRLRSSTSTSPVVPRASAPLARPVVAPPPRRKPRPGSVRLTTGVPRPHDDSSAAAVGKEGRQQEFLRSQLLSSQSQSMSSEVVRSSMPDTIVR